MMPSYVLALMLAIGTHQAPIAFGVHVVSSRSDVVSGGDALVEVTASSPRGWVILLNGLDVTARFRAGERGVGYLALLDGLRDGANLIEGRSGTERISLAVVNHPIAGPVFAGPHQAPFICETRANGLGDPLDSDCSVRTLVRYYYKSKEGVRLDLFGQANSPASPAPGYKWYDPAGPVPKDVEQLTLADGRRVDYLVRREIGTINRAVYDIEMLYTPGEHLPSPWSRPVAGWNGRLVYMLDGGCGAGHHQGVLEGAPGVVGAPFLAQGYAVATATLNSFATTCNDRLSAETLSMVKEHFIKEFGVPVHTIGWGDSGGAMDLHLIAQNYPGLLDGIVPMITFPDLVTAFASVSDCVLLDHAFAASRLRWSEAQKTAVAGYASWRLCATLSALRSPFTDPAPGSDKCDASIPRADVYDRERNAKGARCTIFDNAISVFGKAASTGFGRSTVDNIGLQYGLAAFVSGEIGAEQFVELNELIGGFDANGDVGPARTAADTLLLRDAYERGVVVSGSGLAETPIIDWRPYGDDMADGHDRQRSFATRARLLAANGTAGNQVILVYPRYSAVDWFRYAATHRWEAVYPEIAHDLVPRMDQWLDRIAADTLPGALAAKVIRDRPSELADGCWSTAGEQIREAAVYRGPGRCNELYPAHASPRLVAGAPLADDVLKCALKPIDQVDYAHPLTDDQRHRLSAVFPDGVCDFRRPGVGQVPLGPRWQKF